MYSKSPIVPVYKDLLKEMFKHKIAIEKVIGPFELPTMGDVVYDIQEDEEGSKFLMGRFHIRGSRGLACGYLRAYFTTVLDEGVYNYVTKTEICKMMLEFQPINVTADNMQVKVVIDKPIPRKFHSPAIILSDRKGETKKDLK